MEGGYSHREGKEAKSGLSKAGLGRLLGKFLVILCPLSRKSAYYCLFTSKRTRASETLLACYELRPGKYAFSGLNRLN